MRVTDTNHNSSSSQSQATRTLIAIKTLSRRFAGFVILAIALVLALLVVATGLVVTVSIRSPMAMVCQEFYGVGAYFSEVEQARYAFSAISYVRSTQRNVATGREVSDPEVDEFRALLAAVAPAAASALRAVDF